jgi:hypothetical protein
LQLRRDDQELEGNCLEISNNGMWRDVSDIDMSQDVPRKWTANIDDDTGAAAGLSPFDFNFTSFDNNLFSGFESNMFDNGFNFRSFDNNLFSGFESNMFDNEWHQFLESPLTDLNTATVDDTT